MKHTLTTRHILSTIDDDDFQDFLGGFEKILSKREHRARRDKVSKIRSYGKIYNIGHDAVIDLFKENVIVQEKVDGSQFSFGIRNGELFCRSKGTQQHIEAPDGLFKKAIEVVVGLKDKLQEGWTYRGEYLQKPKHNALCYNRIPKNHIILFDVDIGDQAYMKPDALVEVAADLGLEVVPTFFEGKVTSAAELKKFLEETSVLGGQKIEGFVVKNYQRWCTDGKTMMGKYVSESFKEVAKTAWKKDNPTNKDVIRDLCQMYRTKARWNKALIHAKEDGKLTNDPRDIGPLIKMIKQDIVDECEAEIKERLWQHAKEQILRTAVKGFPEFYKQRLLDRQFDESI